MPVPPLLLSMLITLASGLVAGVAALDHAEACHLLRRTGFAPRPAEVEALLPLSRQAAVRLLLDQAATPTTAPAPSWTQTTLIKRHLQYRLEGAEWRLLSPEERAERQRLRRQRHWQEGQELKAWWLQNLRDTPTPLAENLVAFWHNHFTTELRIVEDPLLIWYQHQLLRQHALGDFSALCRAIPLDVAMWRYLDSDSNVRGRPNENFAREVMELFTVGEGKFSEQDVTEAARAFTGYTIAADGDGRPTKNKDLHDHSIKRILGHREYFDADSIMLVLLQRHEEIALRIAEKMWRHFISRDTDKKAIYELAKSFYRADYQIRPLVEAVLLHEAFWHLGNRGTLFTSPQELLIGAVRQTGSSLPPEKLADLVRQLGHDPFDPPNVKGWHGEDSWISSQSLIDRQAALRQIWQQRDAAASGWLKAGDLGQRFQLLFAPPLPESLHDRLPAEVADWLLLDVYQLK